MPVIGRIRFFRMSCVDSSLCSVSYHITLSSPGSFRSRVSIWGEKHSVINTEHTKVFPLLAFPLTATSSPRAKHGFFSRNRNSNCGNSLSGVILCASSLSNSRSCSGEMPARAISYRISWAACWFIIFPMLIDGFTVRFEQFSKHPTSLFSLVVHNF